MKITNDNKPIIYVATIVAAYYLIRSAPILINNAAEKSKQRKEEKRKRRIQEDIDNSTRSIYTVTKGGKKYTVNLFTMAAIIHDAFHRFYWEDEDTAIQQIQLLPSKPIFNKSTGKTYNLIKELAIIYNNRYQKNLKDDFVKYLTANQFKKVANYFNYV
jgi:hypothetical protein